ncbi:unnamed protein product [Lampetra planeri]
MSPGTERERVKEAANSGGSRESGRSSPAMCGINKTRRAPDPARRATSSLEEGPPPCLTGRRRRSRAACVREHRGTAQSAERLAPHVWSLLRAPITSPPDEVD